MPAKTYLWYHIVLTTKYRRVCLTHAASHLVATAAHFFADRRGGEVLEINTGEDQAHIHLIVALPPNIALSAFVRDWKSMSSRWVRSDMLIQAHAITGEPLPDRKNDPSMLPGLWAARYFARTVGAGSLAAARLYVKEQQK